MNPKNKWFYVHTLNGHVAQYYKGEQICYANGTRGQSGVIRVAGSIRQIKKEQHLSIKWRIIQGFSANNHDYNYIRIARSLFK